MTDQHGMIEFINHHSVNAHVDILDEDGDEYFIATLAPRVELRQYTPAGTRWSVRIAHGIGLQGAAFVNVRDKAGAERAAIDLGGLRGAGDPEEGWTVEIQYVVTARPGSQTYTVGKEGLREVIDAAVGAPGGPRAQPRASAA
jgi:hypothetical protein